MFDGADRPNVKRGKRISGARAIGEEKNFRKMIEAFGYEHWTVRPLPHVAARWR